MLIEPRKLHINIGGGLGDQICAEPIIRYMQNTWFKNDDFVITTHYPDLFSHLNVKLYNAQINTEMRMIANTHPSDADGPSKISFQKIHPVDYIAIRLLRRTLPNALKTIQLKVDPLALKKIQIFLGDNHKKCILLHAGAGWDSKTFDANHWNSYIRILQKNGFFVCLIGREFSVNAVNHGTVAGLLPVDWDSRNQLSLKELIALISVCPLLISNDSAPVHIAGAFDNHIGLIASCKDPSYILPYRECSQYYKTRSLEHYKAYELDFDYDPLIYDDVPIHYLTAEKRDLIPPSAEEVLNLAIEATQKI